VLSRPALTPFAPAPAREFHALNAAPGHIYFIRDGHPWRISPDGTGEAQLSPLTTAGPVAPSPDGSTVAFISGNALFVAPSSGGNARQVASASMADGQRPGWSPDGSTLGYLAYDPAVQGREEAFAVPVAGGQPTLMAALRQGVSGRGPRYDSAVKWSPDGDWVTVSGPNSPSLLLRWPLSKGGPNDERDIPGGEPDWSPDGTELVYTESINGALILFDVVETAATPFKTERQLVGTRLGEYGQGPAPVWSPASLGTDDDLIAYRSASPAGEPRVAVRTRLSLDLSPLPASTNSPSWSPSGVSLVVETGLTRADTFGPKWVATGLAICDLNFKGEQTVRPLVANASLPVWGK
jgi:Tol biopolymer transport system component